MPSTNNRKCNNVLETQSCLPQTKKMIVTFSVVRGRHDWVSKTLLHFLLFVEGMTGFLEHYYIFCCLHHQYFSLLHKCSLYICTNISLKQFKANFQNSQRNKTQQTRQCRSYASWLSINIQVIWSKLNCIL
jgi:hypothetical protein